MHLMHPDDGLTGEVVLRWLEDIEINDMHAQCKEATVRQLREDGVLTREDAIVTQALHELGV